MAKHKSLMGVEHEIEHCCLDSANIKNLVPSTLEGCVVRISDIIAYLGKDRQDAEHAKNISNDSFNDSVIGTINAEIINNLITNIVENSYGKPYIKMDKSHFEALKKAKSDNYDHIYMDPESTATMNDSVKPMMAEIYDAIIDDLKGCRKSSPVYTHHIDLLNSVHYTRETPYEMTDPDQIAVDFIASRTDDYFIELYQYMYPDSNYHVTYKGYFD